MFPCYAYDQVLFAHYDGGSDDPDILPDAVTLSLALLVAAVCYGLLFAVA
jgi:hypothetical protein